MFSRDIHTKIFAEGGWDKRIQAEITAAVVRALEYEEYNVRSSAVRILTGVIAQGALLCFHEIFMLKYSQKACRTRYLTLSSLPRLDVD